MDDFDFQQQVRALKERVSEMSTRYSPTMPTQSVFSNQLVELKRQVSSMQSRLMRQERQMSTAPSISAADVSPAKPNCFLEPGAHIALPSGPLFWQLFNNLRTDMRSLDGRVATLENSLSELEDRVDELDPNRFTPPSSTSGSDCNHYVHDGLHGPETYNCNEYNELSELSSGPSFPIAAYQIRPLQAESSGNVGPHQGQSQPACEYLRSVNEQRSCGDEGHLCHWPTYANLLHGHSQQQDHSPMDAIESPRYRLDHVSPLGGSTVVSVQNAARGLHYPRSDVQWKDQEAPFNNPLHHLQVLRDSDRQDLRNAELSAQPEKSTRIVLEGKERSTGPLTRDHSGGLAFRDREIARLDEQLRTSQERLRVSQENLNDSQNALIKVKRHRDDLQSSIHDLVSQISDLEDKEATNSSWLRTKDAEIGDLYSQIDEKNNTIESWERSWTRLRAASLRESETAKTRELRTAEERERVEHEMEQTVREHRVEMKSIQSFCKQKDGVIYKQEQIISRGKKLLEERDREIELLQRDLRVAKDDKEHALRTADRTARLLEERNAEPSDLKWRTTARDEDRGSSSAYKREEQQSYTRTNAAKHEDAMDTKAHTASTVLHSNRERHAFESSSSRTPQSYNERLDDRAQDRSSAHNRQPRRARSRDRIRNALESKDRSWRQRNDFRDSWPARPPQNGRNSETGYRESSSVEPIDTEQPPQGPPFDATFQPPLPAPVRILRTESEANLRNATRDGKYIPARKTLSKYQSMNEMRGSLQPYVESDVESGGELGGEV